VERRGRWRRSLVAVRDVIVEVNIEMTIEGSKFKVWDDSATATNGHRSATVIGSGSQITCDASTFSTFLIFAFSP
jgi:hypothetical protein